MNDVLRMMFRIETIKYPLLYLIFWGISTVVNGQNLVPNFSFEQYSACPSLGSQLYLVQPWFSPTVNTPDYFNSCASNYNVPNAGAGFQYAYEGNGYVGIYAVEENNVGTEYIGVKLFEPLEADSTYCISFHISLGEGDGYYCSLQKIGAYVSTDSLHISTTGYLQFTPQIENDEIIEDPTIWYEIEGTYLAAGGEQFLYIGNFDSADNAVNCNYNFSGEVVALYVDDVSVEKSPSCNSNLDSLILPNAISPNGDGINDVIEIPTGSTQILTSVYNRWGNLVFRYKGLSVFWDGTCNGNLCSDGIYFITAMYELDNTAITKQSFIHLFH